MECIIQKRDGPLKGFLSVVGESIDEHESTVESNYNKLQGTL